MSYALPTFSPEQFELRGYTNPFLTEEQQTAVNLVEARVNGQLDWVAQLLGWNGANYWTNLTSSVDQKRQLLTGTYGVYNSFIIPEIVSIQNWNNKVVVVEDARIQANQQVYLNQSVYTIKSFTKEKDLYYLDLGILPDQFYSDISENYPLKIAVPSSKPAPFYRPKVGISGDQSFICGASGGQLTLYPYYDAKKTNPYKINILFAGSYYYFDQDVYITYNGTTKDIVSQYDQAKNLWYFQIPENLSTGQIGLTATLVWPQYNPTTGLTTNFTLLLTINNWLDPSDWGNKSALENFRGTWGNKGGFLPFNFAFDALSLHGFNESNSLHLPPVTREIPFNTLLQLIYYQQITISLDPPPTPQVGEVWWNNETGSFSVWYEENPCGAWLEIDYQNLPDFEEPPEYVYPDVATFELAKDSLPLNTYVLISDTQGAGTATGIIGLQDTLVGSAELFLFKVSNQLWMPYKFVVFNENQFNLDAKALPYGIPVNIQDSDGLEPEGATKNYKIDNLAFTVGSPVDQDLPLTVTKYYTNTQWVVSPNSILKYIANTRLFSTTSTPLQGEGWWDYGNPNPSFRSAALYYQDAWVEINPDFRVAAPPALFDTTTVVVYCNGQQITEGEQYRADNFVFSYSYDSATGNFVFSYNPFSFTAALDLPVITVSDDLTSVFRKDITNLVFSGLQYYMSPNVEDAETLLRLWKLEGLQVVDSLDLLERKIYSNSFRADVNSGPGPENWEKFFVRLPPAYQRNGPEWQKVNLICQDFANFGSSSSVEKMECPPEDDTPVIYEEIFLFGLENPNIKTIYSEPYLYSNVAFSTGSSGEYENSAVFPTQETPFDEFTEGALIDYEPLHTRTAILDEAQLQDEILKITAEIEVAVKTRNSGLARRLTSQLEILKNKRYGDWEGIYLGAKECVNLTGFPEEDLLNKVVERVQAPVWDASIYKYAPTCNYNPESYYVDANHYKVGYAYFAADLSAAEEGFFDVQQEYAWRYPQTQPKTGYLTPAAVGG